MSTNELKYSQDHEWVDVVDGIATVGVTEYAAGEMGDVVFLELPETGEEVEGNGPVGTIETVKSVEDLFCPVSGEIIEVNEDVLDAPEIVNSSPLDDGWLFKVKLSDVSEIDSLMSLEDYKSLIGS